MMLSRKHIISLINENEIVEKNGIKIQEISFLNKINLRINPNNNLHMSTCVKILDVILPIKPNTYSQNEKIKTMWLSPDEWLIVHNLKENIFVRLKNEIGDIDASVTDITESKTFIRISGEKIFTLLSKFLVLNLEKNLSNENSCAQTLFVKVPILLVRNHKYKQIPEIDILANNSHADYIFKLILDGTKNLDF